MVNVRGDIPDKVYYSIGEVSEYTGIEPHVLRFWETKIAKLSPKRIGGHQRKYTRADLELVFQIIDLVHNQGFSLQGADKRLSGGSASKEEIDTTPDGIQREISLLKQELQAIVDFIQ